MRSSLSVRLAAASLAVAAVAVAATAYLTTGSTADRIERDASRSLDVDLQVRDALTDHGLRTPGWVGVDAVVARLAASSGRHVTLTTTTGELIADADPDGASPARALPDRVANWGTALGDPAALLDPVAAVADPSELTFVVLGARVQPPAAGLLVPPPLLPDDDPEADQYRTWAETPPTCLTPSASRGGWAPIDLPPPCDTPAGGQPNRFATLQSELAGRIVECATGSGVPAWIGYDTAGLARVVTDAADSSAARLRGCAGSVRAEAFADDVAPAALLYLTAPDQPDRGWVAGAGGIRIVVTLSIVLAVAVAAAAALTARIVRPVRSLTQVAQRLSSGDRSARVEVRGHDELAALGSAFNGMADSLSAAETQRRQLVTDVAHELRNPLTNVRGYLEAAQDRVVPIDDDLVASLLAETRQLQRLVDDLQDAAQAEVGRLRLTVAPLDLAELVAGVAAAHAPEAHRRGITLNVHGVAAPTIVDGDATRLRQVLANLLDNALRHTPPGGTIKIALDTGSDTATVAVADSGAGIAPEHLPHVFDRFYRADPSRARATGGTGLGLAICKHLVEAHRGTITATSARGSGTTFAVELPHAPNGPKSTPAPCCAPQTTN